MADPGFPGGIDARLPNKIILLSRILLVVAKARGIASNFPLEGGGATKRCRQKSTLHLRISQKKEKKKGMDHLTFLFNNSKQMV